MDAKAESVQASFTLTLRYAAVFGGIISLMLLLANIERNGNPQGLQHHISGQYSP